MINIYASRENSTFWKKNVSLGVSKKENYKLQKEVKKGEFDSGLQDKPKPNSKPNWDHEEDNCGINPDENPCGDANEY